MAMQIQIGYRGGGGQSLPPYQVNCLLKKSRFCKMLCIDIQLFKENYFILVFYKTARVISQAQKLHILNAPIKMAKLATKYKL